MLFPKAFQNLLSSLMEIGIEKKKRKFVYNSVLELQISIIVIASKNAGRRRKKNKKTDRSTLIKRDLISIEIS